jgi:hypothetical protein
VRVGRGRVGAGGRRGVRRARRRVGHAAGEANTRVGLIAVVAAALDREGGTREQTDHEKRSTSFLHQFLSILDGKSAKAAFANASTPPARIR